MIAFTISSFVLLTILYEWFRGTRARHRMRAENYLEAFWELIMANRPRYGGYIVHIGIILLAIGVTGSSLFDVSKEASLKPGESMIIKQYDLLYENTDQLLTQNANITTATISVSNAGKPIGQLAPQKTFYRNSQQWVSKVAIRSTLREDLYIILISSEEDGTAAFKVLVNPLVSWIWMGGIILVLGGLIAFWPERRQSLAPVRLD